MDERGDGARGATTQLPLDGAKILVVEDEFLIMMDLQMQLEDQGAVVVGAASVAAGLEKVEAACDAAILDVRLPDGEVYPVAEALRDRDVPFLFHSGHARRDELDLRFPGAPAVTKPAAEPVLVRAVADLLAP